MVPALAVELDKSWRYLSESEEADALQGLAVAMHRRGVNVRHIGLLRSLCTQLKTRQLLAVEMAKRALKNELRALLRREITAGGDKVSIHRVRGVVADFLTELTSGADSDMWCQLPDYITSRYGDFCTEKSLQSCYKHRHLRVMVNYLLDSIGLGTFLSLLPP